jgi:hypothetical protein
MDGTLSTSAHAINGPFRSSLFVKCKQFNARQTVMDRFDAMCAFVRVVEAGSFTKAAETLDMSKTTVTHLVQQLEARLCVKLLRAGSRSHLMVSRITDGRRRDEPVERICGAARPPSRRRAKSFRSADLDPGAAGISLPIS